MSEYSYFAGKYELLERSQTRVEKGGGLRTGQDQLRHTPPSYETVLHTCGPFGRVVLVALKPRWEILVRVARHVSLYSYGWDVTGHLVTVTLSPTFRELVSITTSYGSLVTVIPSGVNRTDGLSLTTGIYYWTTFYIIVSTTRAHRPTCPSAGGVIGVS